MIKVKNRDGFEYTVVPTIFPDKTSQVWKLPKEIYRREVDIVWFFEEEREIIDLFSLAKITRPQSLLIPYLPYGRQDKPEANDSTFNLYVLLDLLEYFPTHRISTIDAHNPYSISRVWRGHGAKIDNISVNKIHQQVIKDIQPHMVVFPDQNAADRYSPGIFLPRVICDKNRDQSTGDIVGHKISHIDPSGCEPIKFLIIDDLVDGGATFISVAKLLHKHFGSDILHITLFVTHGIFSRGRQHLLDNGIDMVLTTNSILTNGDGYDINTCFADSA